MPFSVAGVSLVYGGYVDYAGPEGSLVDTIYSDTQLLLGVGKWLGCESHLFVGVEFRYIHNQFILMVRMNMSHSRW